MAEALKDKQIAVETPIEIWFQDEARIGQKNSLVYQWAKRGSRPRQPKDQRYENAYLFGAICPARDIGVGLVMPYADTFAMQAHLARSACISPTAASRHCSSIKPDGTQQASSSCQATSCSCRYRRNRQS